MIFALDTNVLAYFEGVNDDQHQTLAVALLDRLPPDEIVIPIQVLAELFNVLVRKAGRPPAIARARVSEWHESYFVTETTPDALTAAFDLAVDHQFRIWDAVILAVASRAGCRLLLSEDLHHGFTWGGVTIVNPFATPRHPLLEIYLDNAGR